MKRLSMPSDDQSLASNYNDSIASSLDSNSLFFDSMYSSAVSSSGAKLSLNNNNNMNLTSASTSGTALSKASQNNFASSADLASSNTALTAASLIGSSTSLSLLKSANAQLAINIQNIAANQSGPLAISSNDDNNPFEMNDNHRDYLLRPHQQETPDLNQLIINNSSELRNLWVQLYHTSDGLQFTTRSINAFKKINNCITGRELVEWLMKKKSVSK
jgi:hypothetical protein